MAFDLDEYFARIGYSGARAPTLETLHALTLAHTSSIPFENLDVLLGRTLPLDVDSLHDKLVRRRRGGYCFEQNGYFLHVLRTLGFAARPLSARGRLITLPGGITPRTHLFLRVELGGDSWLTDVGMGGLSLTSAVRLALDVTQQTPHEPRQIVWREGRFVHRAKLADGWSDVNEFTLEEMPEIDREVAHWYTSAHPRSHFKSMLMVARAGADGTRITMLDDELGIRGRDGVADKRKLDPEQRLAALAEHFGLSFPAQTQFVLAPRS